LNKKYDQLKVNQTDDNTGPLEAKNKHLEKEISKIELDTDNMRKEWISKTNLVFIQGEYEELKTELSELNMKKVILEQKRLRLDNNIESQHKEIKRYETTMKSLQNDMNRLNDKLSKDRGKVEGLTNENFNFETEFLEKLKELELCSSELDIRIDSIKEQKATILQEIVECERQICLWERKIQLEREMQETIDPSIGQAEVQQMKKEIHRMELRFDQLRKKQEAIQEMENAVFKRETIQLK